MFKARKTLAVFAVSAATLLVISGCGSSSKSAGSTSSSSTAGGAASTTGGAGSGRTYTIGLLTDLTGPAAGTNLDATKGVQAGVGLAGTEGYHIKYVVADSASTPAGTLAGAQKLVEQDHVFAVVADSALTFAASSFLASKGVPVIGPGQDGPEWLTTKNMFSIAGYEDFTKVFTPTGVLLKMLGGTVIGSIGTGVSPSSSESAKAAVISAQAAGLKAGYLNANLPYGSSNVAPIALAMKAAGVDAVTPVLDQVTAFNLLKALKNEGVNYKVALLAQGYGGDLTSGGPGSSQAAQGVYFQTSWEPVELHTAATEQFQNALKTYAGQTGDPFYGEYTGYLEVAAFVDGLKAAGPNPSQASLINAMLGITNYNGAGLYGNQTISFAMSTRGQGFGAGNCFWVSQYLGTTFHPVKGASPICGQLIPGKTVSASS